jgi:hypothetical protein
MNLTFAITRAFPLQLFGPHDRSCPKLYNKHVSIILHYRPTVELPCRKCVAGSHVKYGYSISVESLGAVGYSPETFSPPPYI